MFAGRFFQAKAQQTVNIQSDGDLNVICKKTAKLYGSTALEFKSDGNLTLNSKSGGWQGGENIVLQAGGIDLNGAAAPTVTAPEDIVVTVVDSTEFDSSTGWQVVPAGLTSIASRVTAHEPWPYHNQGVDVAIKLETGTPTPPPGAIAVPPGVEIERTE
jgi:hypothetical protein